MAPYAQNKFSAKFVFRNVFFSKMNNLRYSLTTSVKSNQVQSSEGSKSDTAEGQTINKVVSANTVQ